MNIPAFTSTAIAPSSFSAVVGIDALAAPADLFAPPASTATDSAASIVDLSNLGQMLSAAAAFQTQQVAAGPGGQDAGAGFGKLVTATQLFVDALNNLQASSSDSLLSPLGAPFDNALLFALNAQPAPDTGKSLLASLALVGINFQEASISGGAGQFGIDLTALQSAFNAAPAATTSSLAQAFQALGQLVARLVIQNVSPLATDANSALLGTASAVPFDVSAIAGQIAGQSPALNSVDGAAVDAALQRLLADQALGNALGANPAPAQAAATVNAVTAAPVDNNAAASPTAPPVAVAAQATIDPGVGDNGASTIAATATISFAAIANPRQAVASLDSSAVADGGAVQTTGIIEEPANPAAILQNLAAASAVQSGSIDTGAGTGLSGAQTPLPLTDFNNSRFLAIDPSVAAAIAAYRVGDGFFGTPANDAAQRLPELIADIVAVTRIRPVTLDPHDGTSDGWRSEAARNAVQSVDQRKALAATYGLSSSQRAVHLAV